MSQFLYGCQTITFGDDQYERFSELFGHIAEVGYAGVEIGFRRINPVKPENLRTVLAENGLSLCGSHIGGNLEEPDQANSERNVIQVVLDYLEQVGTKVLMYSGLRYREQKQFKKDLAMLNKSADLCRRRGVRLLYHNHDWEMEDNAFILRTLVEDGSDALGFCPDVGWIAKGGMDPIEILEMLKRRIGMIHFKDFATMKPGVDTVELGEGVVPLRKTTEWIRENIHGLWIIAEQDRSAVPPEDAVRKNAAYLRTLFSGEE